VKFDGPIPASSTFVEKVRGPYILAMSDVRRDLVRKLENVEAFPLIALQALRELRADLDGVEAEAILRARELGASLEDIAEAMEITRQGVAYKLKAIENGNGEDTDDEILDVREPHTDTKGPHTKA
jgi:hypothetical protein